MKRHDDDAARSWCDVGQYRACLERDTGLMRFAIHGKPDLSQGFAQPVVLARGWIHEDDAVEYSPGSRALPEDLERQLLAASRRMSMRAISD